MNIYDYVKSYTESMSEKEFNEVDNLVLSCLTYLDFTGIVPQNKTSLSLEDAGRIYLDTYKKRDIAKIGIAQRDAYKLLELVIASPRFKSIGVSRYRYITSLDSQFSAMTFKIDKHLKFIGFEGTDELLSGWKEDAYISFKFPVDAQKYAIDYINEAVSLFDSKIIVGGHSKGGNLALVASMFANPLLKHKVKRVYSNDGPGLRKEEYESNKYKKIKPKYTHIIPTHSLIGTLLYNDEYVVVKTTNKNILAHTASSWVIEDDHFVYAKQDKKSIQIEKKLNEYIASISYSEQKRIVDAIFRDLEHQGYKTVNDFLNLRKLLKSIKNLKNIDPTIKDTLIEVVEIIITNYVI